MWKKEKLWTITRVQSSLASSSIAKQVAQKAVVATNVRVPFQRIVNMWNDEYCNKNVGWSKSVSCVVYTNKKWQGIAFADEKSFDLDGFNGQTLTSLLLPWFTKGATTCELVELWDAVVWYNDLGRYWLLR